jgi:ribonuclease P protein component
MLAKKHRISKKKEVETVFKGGRSSFDGVLGVKLLPAVQPYSRFVIVVSTKVSKKAVERNEVKRRLSEACRLLVPDFKKDSDCFVLALPGSVQKTYRELEQSLRGHFKKLGVLK